MSDAQAEKSLIGSICLVPNVLDEIGVSVIAEDFNDPRNAIMFRTAHRMYDSGKVLDALTLADELRATGELDQAGGDAWIVECMEAVPHAAHARFHAGIVAEKSQRRRLSVVGTQAVEAAHDLSREVDDSIADTEIRLSKILERRAGNETTDIGAILADALVGIREGKGRGLTTGFTAVDQIVNGFVPQNLVIIAARPSIGKTAFATNMAHNVTCRGIPVGLLTLEQAPTEIAERLLSSQARMAVSDMRSTGLTEAQVDSLLTAANDLSKLPLIIDGCQYRGIAAIEASARLMARRSGIKLLIVDYLQLIAGQERRDSREQEVAEISRRLKWLAKTLQIPVIALAQLNRESEKRTDKKPKLSDLRESGAIEQDADVVILLHRDEFYDPAVNPGQAIVIVSKNRNGRTGEAQLQFQGNLMQFRDLAPGHMREPPMAFNPSDDFAEYR